MAETQKKQNVTISVSRRFTSSPERVYDAWLEPETAGKWLFATPAGKMTKIEIDPRIGGKFTITEQRGEMEAEHVGKYIELKRPHRLVFDFGVPKYTNEITRVALDLIPKDKGCELTLTHEGVWPDYAEKTKQGWTGILNGLAKTLGE